MTAAARLLALRLQGFKSFAERTVVEFGPGISAVVGPNGSGKSNLADALRWALGEQGRALRSKRSEDVIFAGSERRSALGMADVTLVLDNADRLLPVEFATIELGRRLYRSGENDYLLNRQRIRLRDLVDLLDAAHLADNAFLFIGQGMVDQALALRPEERRPLFEEVAGVRRHDRRRRRAEEQLAEAEANLARVEDVLAELRPQARRLGIQAEQQASRQTAGREFGRAVLASGHVRWRDASSRASEAGDRHRRGRLEADRALAALREAEEAAGAIARDLGARSEVEAERRAAHDAARGELTDLQVRQARLGGELEAVGRDRRRTDAERAGAEADRAEQRRSLAVNVPPRDLSLEAAIGDAERALAEAADELRMLRTARQARGEALAALRRAEAARQAELDTARRRLLDAERRLEEELAAESEAGARAAELGARLESARAAGAAARQAEREASVSREEARSALDEAEAARQAAGERLAAARSHLAAVRGRHDALAARLDEEEARGIARAARKRGGRLLDDGLDVAPALRVAVEATLGEAVRAYLVHRDAVGELAAERGVLVIADAATGESGRDAIATDAPTSTGRGRGRPGDGQETGAAAIVARAVAAGGGSLADGVRRDPTGAVRSLLARAIWLPDLPAALVIQPILPPGWVAATPSGALVTAAGTVVLGRPESRLERRAEVAHLASELERLEAECADETAAATVASVAAREARDRLEAVRSDEARAAAARRQAETEEQRVGRDLEAATREATWHRAQSSRLAAERDRLAESVGGLEPTDVPEPRPELRPGSGNEDEETAALREWEARVAELRARRDRLAAEQAEQDRVRRQAEERLARASAALALDEERIGRADLEAAELEAAERRIREDLDIVGRALALAMRREQEARAAVDALLAADATDRGRLAAAETAAAAARDRLRSAEEHVRAAEVAELETRLALESIREQVIVELAGLGELGLRLVADALDEEPWEGDRTVPEVDDDATDGTDSTEVDATPRLEAALDRLGARWSADPPPVEAPAPARLAQLRRRYHDLGAANPFAVEEYASVRARLELLEAQRADLHAAIGRTRALIEELGAMITEQFQSTFRALETAFDARFRQLFGGGFARLSLTDPDDLTATGVEIVARPPGKKAQALSMLSGGERALTAVALLFAMLEVRPVPFCVLDEVDAALDEANVGRFTAALQELASTTQCIVITHNRGTIESADALYGATIGDDAVSRIISLRLEEATAIAESIRPADALAPAR